MYTRAREQNTKMQSGPSVTVVPARRMPSHVGGVWGGSHPRRRFPKTSFSPKAADAWVRVKERSWIRNVGLFQAEWCYGCCRKERVCLWTVPGYRTECYLHVRYKFRNPKLSLISNIISSTHQCSRPGRFLPDPGKPVTRRQLCCHYRFEIQGW